MRRSITASRPRRDARRGAGGLAREKIARLGLAGPGQDRAEGLSRDGGRVRQDRVHRHVRACRDRELPDLFSRPSPAAAAARPLSCTTPSPAAPSAPTRPSARSGPSTGDPDPLHLPRRRTRPSRHVGANLERYGFEVHDVEGWREHYQRTARLWCDRLPAEIAEAVAEVGEVRRGCGCSISPAARSPSSAAASASTRRCRRAHARPVRPAVDPGGSVS